MKKRIAQRLINVAVDLRAKRIAAAMKYVGIGTGRRDFKYYVPFQEGAGKAKGVSNLIEIENPNRVQKKTKKLVTLNTQLNASSKPELSRREREEIEKQRAQAHYQKLHAEGKTEQARADLARLAIIKQQREEAQKKREIEKKEKEEAVKQKTAQMGKALGKKT